MKCNSTNIDKYINPEKCQENNQSIMSKFCKVCFEAGKEESVFKSHFVRSGPGMNCPVVCPTLLATECKYCHKVGHTVKYCDVLKNNEKHRRRERFASRVPTAKTALKDKNSSSMFDVLHDSDSEEEDVVVEEKVLRGWAAIAALPPAPAPSPAPSPAPAPLLKVEPNAVSVSIEGISMSIGNKMRSWADWSDSDSDEE